MYRQLGAEVLRLAGAAKTQFLAASAFIKADALERVLQVLGSEVSADIFVRWRLDDLAAGASDWQIYELARQRPLTQIWMCRCLHAKYYRNEVEILLGSANLTSSGLGWCVQANLELLVASTFGDADRAFEDELRAQSVLVDDRLAEKIRSLLEKLPPGLPHRIEFPPPLRDPNWLPAGRDPEMLYFAYMGDLDSFTRSSKKAAIQDLGYLNLPPGLNQSAFEAYVAMELIQSHWVRRLDGFLNQPRRFGEVSNWIRAEFGVEDSKHTWQTLLRWLLKFLPDQFRADVYDYSEVVSRR